MKTPGHPNTSHAAPVELRGISRWFGMLKALDGVDLTLQPGEIHGLLGENGAGKSTLMNILAGVLRPHAGTVSVAGQRLIPGSPSDSAAHGIGMVHQHFSLIPALTVAENLSLASGHSPFFFRRSADLAPSALTVAAQLGWRFNPKTPVWQLPVGHQQRLEIVKVLQRDARWLILDEPTAVLSPPETEELFAVLERLKGEGRGIVLITHKLGEVLRLCDRITVLRRGQRVGETGRSATAEALARMMVGSAEGEDRAGVDPKNGTLHVSHAAASGLRGQPRSAPRDPTPSDPTEPALVVRDLRVRDDRGGEAVRGLSFEVRRGEIFGVAGVDGNGQAELAEAIVGLRRAAAGSVRVSRGDRGSRPGYVPPDRRRAGLILPMSVRENLALETYMTPTHRRGPFLRLSRLWSTTRAMAQRFDIRVTDERQPAATLSGGNQQRIVLARALFGDRSLLVAVNPTRGLDVGATRFVHDQLRTARDAGVAVLLISTELDELLELSDRVGVLYSGRWQGIVPPTESRDRIGQMMGGVGGPAPI